MRVIAGAAKGRKLKTPFAISGLRPTSDKVREAVFDIIGPDIVDACFLDLFCGTGAVGIEALSRGARMAVFVDSRSSAIDLLKENLSRCGFEQNVEIMQCDTLQAISTLGNRQRRFDIIFMDPPYGSDLIMNALAAIPSGDVLLPGTRVLVEHAARNPVSEGILGLTRQREYRFGDTAVTLFHCAEA